MDIIGDLDRADVEKTNWDFVVGDNAASKIGDLFWFGPFKPLARLMFQTPMVNAFIMGSFVYHDYIWYPTQGRKVVNKWLQETEWGALFQQYAPTNADAEPAGILSRLRPRSAT